MRTTYSDETILALTGTYQTIKFNGAADLLIIYNDETTANHTIEYSFNGADKAGELRHNQQFAFDKLNGYGSITLRMKAGSTAAAYRLTVIGK